MSRKKDFTGQKFNKLTFVCEVGRTATGGVIWKLLCDCGKDIETVARKIVSGHTKTCGCGKSEHMTNMKTRHGLFWKSRKLYQVWVAMRGRCANRKNKSFRDYGARGISVAEDWHDYAVFYDWAMLNGYKDGLEIDRIDNNNNYCPENCRFISKSDHIKSHWADGTFDNRGKRHVTA